MISRRSFLSGCLAACAAPAIVRAASLMPVRSTVPSYLTDDSFWVVIQEPLLSVEPTRVFVPSFGYFDTVEKAMEACRSNDGPIYVFGGHFKTSASCSISLGSAQ